jgi:hypothetical protein
MRDGQVPVVIPPRSNVDFVFPFVIYLNRVADKDTCLHEVSFFMDQDLRDEVMRFVDYFPRQMILRGPIIVAI